MRPGRVEVSRDVGRQGRGRATVRRAGDRGGGGGGDRGGGGRVRGRAGSRLDDDPSDAGGRWERITRFNRYAPYYASNPAVSPDGDRLAFQLSIDGETEGQGDGILLLDLA
jgi:hypothetical protein